ncbi:hypothetical protein [Phytoactinopolyspora endophytica]|uniref:hypothetical protein n=1 Tax=Phytoactinopolyspora endophytica TaxID=1642495 RepID=UPI00101DEF9E|nr:hypothetical protein [Phytoactinopolyspora endophytica]
MLDVQEGWTTADLAHIDAVVISPGPLARNGEFPVPLLRIGASYRARRSDILDALAIDDSESVENATKLVS